MKFRNLAFAAVALSAGVALTACTINISSPSPTSDATVTKDQASRAEFSGIDIMFAQMMIPHHQQAVDMGTLAETRAGDGQVVAIAAEIKAEQAPEIALMQSWLTEAGAPSDMGHEMHMGGMLSTEQMDALAEAKGAEFDRLYLEAMIAHHEGAIDMAQMILDSENAVVRNLGEAIVESQTAQIQRLQELLSSLAG